MTRSSPALIDRAWDLRPASPEFWAFARDMHEQDPTIHFVMDRGDGTCLIVKRLFFHWTLLENVVGDTTSYYDRWCYEDYDGALGAALAYVHHGLGEPEGWHRHHSTGRRRPGGDRSKEYVCA